MAFAGGEIVRQAETDDEPYLGWRLSVIETEIWTDKYSYANATD